MHYIENLFNGRINRKFYFLGLLFFVFTSISLLFILALIFSKLSHYFLIEKVIILYLFLGCFAALFFVIFLFSLYIRRLHDLGMGRNFIFIFFIPFLNILAFLYLLIVKGQENENQYGKPLSGKENFLKVFFNKI